MQLEIPSQKKIPNFELKRFFNFLIVSQMGPRKNMENSIRWWVEEFIDQNVGLIQRQTSRGSSVMDRERTFGISQETLGTYPDRKCSVKLLHGDLSEGQMVSLYKHMTRSKLLSILRTVKGLDYLSSKQHKLRLANYYYWLGGKWISLSTMVKSILLRLIMN